MQGGVGVTNLGLYEPDRAWGVGVHQILQLPLDLDMPVVDRASRASQLDTPETAISTLTLCGCTIHGPRII